MARDRQWVVLDQSQSASKAREPTAREIVEGDEQRKDAPAHRPDPDKEPDD
ncbi:hypothetical protein [Azospirillum sp.]|uniref:hypothetical protein n=1 Tax=Azospirillum sp. TaxID=34012 RepID=UPI003D72C6EC